MKSDPFGLVVWFCGITGMSVADGFHFFFWLAFCGGLGAREIVAFLWKLCMRIGGRND